VQGPPTTSLETRNFEFGERVAMTGLPGNRQIFYRRVFIMTWDQLKSQWKQMKGSVKNEWDKLTDDDLTQIGGDKDKLTVRLQEKYGIPREEAHRRVDEWLRLQSEPQHASAQRMR
jgi:uncharacterized protein YjbJ (UPF0337 family)